jgi:hypothetical protein
MISSASSTSVDFHVEQILGKCMCRAWEYLLIMICFCCANYLILNHQTSRYIILMKTGKFAISHSNQHLYSLLELLKRGRDVDNLYDSYE